MRILVATDGWHPQVNGVVRTYEHLAQELERLGIELSIVAPNVFHTLPCPTYPEIRLALPGWRRLARRFEILKPDAIHVATEGSIGWMARHYCRSRSIPFTTCFRTRFPSTWSIASQSRPAGQLPPYAASTTPDAVSWWQHRAWRVN